MDPGNEDLKVDNQDEINISDGTVMKKVYESPNKQRKRSFQIQYQHLDANQPVTKASKEFQKSSQSHDSDREFFKLTLLSLQLNHKNFNIVKTIDANTLYEMA